MKKKRGASSNAASDIRKEILLDLRKKMTQEEFGKIVGLSQQEISKLYRYQVLAHDGDFGTCILQYFAFLKGKIFARRGWVGLADV